MTTGMTWTVFISIFDGLYSWVFSLYNLLQSVTLISFGSVRLSLFDFGIFFLLMEVIFIVYIRMRS